MIVDNLDVEYGSLFPAKADPPSFVNANAVLTPPVSFQSFEAVTRRRRQILQDPGPVKVQQFSPRAPLKHLEPCHRHIVKEVLGFSVFERLDHDDSLLLIASYIKSNTPKITAPRL